MTIEHTHVERPDGARIAIQVSGPSAAPPLLLLPGQANSHRWWDGLRAAYATAYRTITFDYRGTGDTTGGQGTEWSTRLFAADAVAVLDRLGYSTARVYGASMGGRVAQMMAIDHPGSVEKLVLACTTPGGPHAVERSAAVRRSLADRDPARRRRALIDLFYTSAWAARSNLLGDPTMTRHDAQRHLRASSRHDAYDGLPQIAAPALVLHGLDDLMAPPENAHLLADRIPGARLHLVERGRHGFFDEFAHEVDSVVLDFLRT